jgi:hypothetical protein
MLRGLTHLSFAIKFQMALLVGCAGVLIAVTSPQGKFLSVYLVLQNAYRKQLRTFVYQRYLARQ